ncbi:hypothetical protein AAMO2058_000693200 [Amorphochlora amoebiformis]
MYNMGAAVMRFLGLIFTSCGRCSKQEFRSVGIGGAYRIIKTQIKTIYNLLGAGDDKIVISVLSLLEGIAKIDIGVCRSLCQRFKFGNRNVTSLNVSSKAPRIRSGLLRIALSVFNYSDPALTKSLLGAKGFVEGFFRGLGNLSSSECGQFLKVVSRAMFTKGKCSPSTLSVFWTSYMLEQLIKVQDESECHRVESRKFIYALIDYCHSHASKNSSTTNGPSNRSKVHKHTSGMGELGTKTGGGILEHLLVRLCLKLKPNFSVEQQKILVKICSLGDPWVLERYLKCIPFSFDPRPSLRWLANVTIVCRLVALKTFDSERGKRAPPNVLVSDLFPPPVTRLILSHGVQHKSPIVQWTTLRLIRTILEAYGRMVATCPVDKVGQLSRSLNNHLPALSVLKALHVNLKKNHAKEAKVQKGEGKADSKEQMNAKFVQRRLMARCLVKTMRLYIVQLGSSTEGSGFDPWRIFRLSLGGEGEVGGVVETLSALRILDEKTWVASRAIGGGKDKKRNNSTILTDFGMLLSVVTKSKKIEGLRHLTALSERVALEALMRVGVQLTARPHMAIWISSLSLPLVSFVDQCARVFQQSPFHFIDRAASLIQKSSPVSGSGNLPGESTHSSLGFVLCAIEIASGLGSEDGLLGLEYVIGVVARMLYWGQGVFVWELSIMLCSLAAHSSETPEEKLQKLPESTQTPLLLNPANPGVQALLHLCHTTILHTKPHIKLPSLTKPSQDMFNSPLSIALRTLSSLDREKSKTNINLATLRTKLSKMKAVPNSPSPLAYLPTALALRPSLIPKLPGSIPLIAYEIPLPLVLAYVRSGGEKWLNAKVIGTLVARLGFSGGLRSWVSVEGVQNLVITIQELLERNDKSTAEICSLTQALLYLVFGSKSKHNPKLSKTSLSSEDKRSPNFRNTAQTHNRIAACIQAASPAIRALYLHPSPTVSRLVSEFFQIIPGCLKSLSHIDNEDLRIQLQALASAYLKHIQQNLESKYDIPGNLQRLQWVLQPLASLDKALDDQIKSMLSDSTILNTITGKHANSSILDTLLHTPTPPPPSLIRAIIEKPISNSDTADKSLLDLITTGPHSTRIQACRFVTPDIVSKWMAVKDIPGDISRGLGLVMSHIVRIGASPRTSRALIKGLESLVREGKKKGTFVLLNASWSIMVWNSLVGCGIEGKEVGILKRYAHRIVEEISGASNSNKLTSKKRRIQGLKSPVASPVCLSRVNGEIWPSLARFLLLSRPPHKTFLDRKQLKLFILTMAEQFPPSASPIPATRALASLLVSNHSGLPASIRMEAMSETLVRTVQFLISSTLHEDWGKVDIQSWMSGFATAAAADFVDYMGESHSEVEHDAPLIVSFAVYMALELGEACSTGVEDSLLNISQRKRLGGQVLEWISMFETKGEVKEEKKQSMHVRRVLTAVTLFCLAPAVLLATNSSSKKKVDRRKRKRTDLEEAGDDDDSNHGIFVVKQILQQDDIVQLIQDPTTPYTIYKALRILIQTLLHPPATGKKPNADITVQVVRNIHSLLIQALQGTDSRRDMEIFELVNNIEASPMATEAKLPQPTLASSSPPCRRWGAAAIEKRSASRRRKGLQADLGWVFRNLDVSILRRGPVRKQRQNMRKTTGGHEADLDHQVYNAWFLLPFFRRYCGGGTGRLDVKRFVETGALAYVVLSTSLPEVSLREHAYEILAMIWDALDQTASIARSNAAGIPGSGDSGRFRSMQIGYDFREHSQITTLLGAFKNAVTKEFERIPWLLSRFIARSIPVLLRPDHFMYKQVNRFLLQRPYLDLNDVPMFYGSFNSIKPAPICHKERIWMMKLLSGSVKDSRDFTILCRRHAVAIIASFYTSKMSDRLQKALALQFLERVLRLEVDGTQENENMEEEKEDDDKLDVKDSEGNITVAVLEQSGLLSWIHSTISDESEAPHTLKPVLQLFTTITHQLSNSSIPKFMMREISLMSLTLASRLPAILRRANNKKLRSQLLTSILSSLTHALTLEAKNKNPFNSTALTLLPIIPTLDSNHPSASDAVRIILHAVNPSILDKRTAYVSVVGLGRAVAWAARACLFGIEMGRSKGQDSKWGRLLCGLIERIGEGCEVSKMFRAEIGEFGSCLGELTIAVSLLPFDTKTQERGHLVARIVEAGLLSKVLDGDKFGLKVNELRDDMDVEPSSQSTGSHYRHRWPWRQAFSKGLEVGLQDCRLLEDLRAKVISLVVDSKASVC